ncbi:hypothetical protein ABPG72_002895 [Tetrahymena utriculariae]
MSSSINIYDNLENNMLIKDYNYCLFYDNAEMDYKFQQELLPIQSMLPSQSQQDDQLISYLQNLDQNLQQPRFINQISLNLHNINIPTAQCSQQNIYKSHNMNAQNNNQYGFVDQDIIEPNSNQQNYYFQQQDIINDYTIPQQVTNESQQQTGQGGLYNFGENLENIPIDSLHNFEIQDQCKYEQMQYQKQQSAFNFQQKQQQITTSTQNFSTQINHQNNIQFQQTSNSISIYSNYKQTKETTIKNSKNLLRSRNTIQQNTNFNSQPVSSLKSNISSQNYTTTVTRNMPQTKNNCIKNIGTGLISHLTSKDREIQSQILQNLCSTNQQLPDFKYWVKNSINLKKKNGIYNALKIKEDDQHKIKCYKNLLLKQYEIFFYNHAESYILNNKNIQDKESHINYIKHFIKSTTNIDYLTKSWKLND